MTDQVTDKIDSLEFWQQFSETFSVCTLNYKIFRDYLIQILVSLLPVLGGEKKKIQSQDLIFKQG